MNITTCCAFHSFLINKPTESQLCSKVDISYSGMPSVRLKKTNWTAVRKKPFYFTIPLYQIPAFAWIVQFPIDFITQLRKYSVSLMHWDCLCVLNERSSHPINGKLNRLEL
jgi:hypothetical protein